MTREVPLSRGLVALIDDADWERIVAAGPWCAVPQGHTFYAKAHAVTPEGRPTTVHMHSLILGTRNNQRSNLRAADQSRNIGNSKRRVDNTSGYKGVYREKRTGRWVARITVRRRGCHLGSYDTAEAAARAYDAAALDAWGEFARLNFPREAASA